MHFLVTSNFDLLELEWDASRQCSIFLRRRARSRAPEESQNGSEPWVWVLILGDSLSVVDIFLGWPLELREFDADIVEF